MQQCNRGQGPLYQLYEGFLALRPLFSSDSSPRQRVGCLAEFVGHSVPVCRVAFLRLDSAQKPAEAAFWGESQERWERFYPVFLERYLPPLIDAFTRGQPPEDSAVEEMVRDILGDQTPPYSPTLLPIEREGALLGFLYLGKAREKGPWTEGERAALGSLADILSLFFAQQGRMDDIRLQSFIFGALMDSLEANIYITDPQTDRILYMNRTMKEAFSLKEPEGMICWQVLQSDQEGRCKFCPVQLLLQDPSDNPSCVWEEHNSRTGRTYQNYDSLVQWVDGSRVHLQQSMDITERKALFQAASIDELTGVRNRRSGKKALVQSIWAAQRAALPLVVGFYDVNSLKQINDRYGHLEGDRALQLTAQAVTSQLDSADYAFRLSGDEFCLVFWNSDEAAARAKIEAAKDALSALAEENGLPYQPDFCYGLVQVPLDEGLGADELLSRADEQMYRQKRLLHIQRAEERAAVGETDESVEAFTYDKDRLYDALVQSSDDYVYVCNMKTGTFRYPPAMVEEFDLPCEVVKNAAAVWGSRIHPHDKQAFLESNQEIEDGRTSCHNIEYRAKNRRGEWVWMRCRGHVERDEQGEPVLFAGTIANLGRKNKIDHVTGLLNKFVFEEDVNHFLQERPDQSLSVMVLGLDEFKRVNDLYDRVFGDEVLRITSQKIQTFLPSNATVYRLDGDEFGVIFSGGGRVGPEQFYSALRDIFSRQQEFSGRRYYCTLSAGSAFYPDDANNYLDLFKYASYSLEHAKARGKNQLVPFSPSILLSKERSLDLIEHLRTSVERDFEGFSLAFQPQVDARTGALCGAEALARWQCADYGPVGPSEFIPLLEESGLIHPVGRWIFASAVRTCAQWVDRFPDFSLSINLSYLQLSQPDFLPFLRQTLLDMGVDPAHIVLELTETYIASSADAMSQTFEEIRKTGIRLAMDDFGTGYSSLNILKRAPADIVKIDRDFVKGIQNSRFDATFIRFIVALCHDVGIHVCLEGVETQEEYQIVRPMGLDTIQGFYFARPMAQQDFERWAESGRQQPDN